jgi:hypothetical protein
MTGLAINYGMLPIQGKTGTKMIESANVNIIPAITKVRERFRVSSIGNYECRCKQTEKNRQGTQHLAD